MSTLAASLLVHHPDEIAKPVGLFFLLLVGIVKLLDIFPSYSRQLTAEGAYGIFHLPHVQDVFGNVFLS